MEYLLLWFAIKLTTKHGILIRDFKTYGKWCQLQKYPESFLLHHSFPFLWKISFHINNFMLIIEVIYFWRKTTQQINNIYNQITSSYAIYNINMFIFYSSITKNWFLFKFIKKSEWGRERGKEWKYMEEKNIQKWLIVSCSKSEMKFKWIFNNTNF